MTDNKTIIFDENVYVPDLDKKLPFYKRYEALVFCSFLFILFMARLISSTVFVIAFILLLIPTLYMLFKSFIPDNMLMTKKPVKIEFASDRLTMVRDRIYTTNTNSRKERYTFYYKDLKELKYNKDKQELIIHGEATIEYFPYKHDKLATKTDFKHDAPCFFAMYPSNEESRSFKDKLNRYCPYPIDFTSKPSICANTIQEYS